MSADQYAIFFLLGASALIGLIVFVAEVTAAPYRGRASMRLSDTLIVAAIAGLAFTVTWAILG